MIVIFLLIPLSIIIAICFLVAFIWAVRSGQYEDTCTPAMRLLLEEKRKQPAPADRQTAPAKKNSTSNSGEAKNE
jgi:cbb3-type cytochrome oxidase maturation protein